MLQLISSVMTPWIAGLSEMHNKCQQADLGKLSPFLQKDAKMPPIHPNRCGRRYVYEGISMKSLKWITE